MNYSFDLIITILTYNIPVKYQLEAALHLNLSKTSLYLHALFRHFVLCDFAEFKVFMKTGGFKNRASSYWITLYGVIPAGPKCHRYVLY